ncbi:hypothetical protein L195_g029698 [Trifolium pratense]|uniref:Uncharacterized protein n=1 Tax=Trifolium pratense TaxID=57577 RepID=A0A2K3L5H7_TRIPR|nr:hypothetical protein L195_g029698 [Trifolium pratense]
MVLIKYALLITRVLSYALQESLRYLSMYDNRCLRYFKGHKQSISPKTIEKPSTHSERGKGRFQSQPSVFASVACAGKNGVHAEMKYAAAARFCQSREKGNWWWGFVYRTERFDSVFQSS